MAGKREARSARAAPTAALEAIWRTVAKVPRGSVTTYGGVAARAGFPRRARLVGHALKVAPKTLSLPWHRVVGAGGRIAFPPGSAAHREQRRRLIAEGILVVRGRVQLPRAPDLDALLWGGGRC
ncbi:MAG TPA: methylated-DNA--[protein]-cysteine S-methyltransferase [Steroidobacteraceae bacterium]|nr:methylated-DNA--[protein]-cysteine S-methyltransferase [Steroidobacteraceae bacterium]